MNVWLFQTGEPLPLAKGVREMRTAMLANALITRQHHVLWWASAFEHQQKKWIVKRDQDVKISKKLNIKLLRGTGYRNNLSLARYIDHLIVSMKFKRLAPNLEKPDVILASTPCYHLAYEAMRYAKKHKIPLIVDIRDLWPDTFLLPISNNFFRRLGRMLLFRDFRKITELMQHADSLVSMSKGCLRWGLDKIPRSAGAWDRVFYLGYKKEMSRTGDNRVEKRPAHQQKKMFLFVGTFGKSYQLELILETARKLHEEGRYDIVFTLAGTGKRFEKLKNESKGLPNFKLTGWINSEEIQELLGIAWAGIVPCKSVENAAPNKVFEYLSGGLPLVSSLEGEVAELIDQFRVGMNYSVGNAGALYRCIKTLADNPELRNEIAENALHFFNQYGDADKIYPSYAHHIEKIAAT